MQKSDFLLEVENVLMSDDRLNEDSGVNLTSLATLSLIAFIDENFDMQVNAADLKKITTVKDIINLIGVEKIKD
jgi:acyl carrier protein